MWPSSPQRCINQPIKTRNRNVRTRSVLKHGRGKGWRETYIAALSLRLGALAADVTGFVAVVATLTTGSGASGGGAVAGKVTDTTTVVAAAATTGTAETATGAGTSGGAGASDVAVLTALVALTTGTASSRGGVGGAVTALSIARGGVRWVSKRQKWEGKEGTWH